MYDERDSSARRRENMNEGSSPEWNWDALVPHLIHPTKVHILEALLWIGQPLSAADLEKVFHGVPRLGVIAYHIKCLANPGILKCVSTRQVRGATEHFYWLAGVSRR